MVPPFETSPVLADLRHGFFGRAGGTSGGVYAGNNVSLTTGDDAGAVAVNRAGIAGAMGYAPAQLVILKQTHSIDVYLADAPLASDTVIEADALVTSRPGLLLGIMTADCTPILFADAEAGVVGAVHAGWKGAVGGIIEATLTAMLAQGARIEHIAAAVGPTISGANYEVGAQFAAALQDANPAADRWIFTPEGGREHFDLPGFVTERLTAAGIEQVDRVGGCTYAQPERYFSHRYATHHQIKTGRQLAVIGLT